MLSKSDEDHILLYGTFAYYSLELEDNDSVSSSSKVAYHISLTFSGFLLSAQKFHGLAEPKLYIGPQIYWCAHILDDGTTYEERAVTVTSPVSFLAALRQAIEIIDGENCKTSDDEAPQFLPNPFASLPTADSPPTTDPTHSSEPTP